MPGLFEIEGAPVTLEERVGGIYFIILLYLFYHILSYFLSLFCGCLLLFSLFSLLLNLPQQWIYGGTSKTTQTTRKFSAGT